MKDSKLFISSILETHALLFGGDFSPKCRGRKNGAPCKGKKTYVKGHLQRPGVVRCIADDIMLGKGN